MNTLHHDPEGTATALATDTQAPPPVRQSARIEAYGVKGMNSRPWRRTFKSADALMAWCEKHGAEIYGQRFDDGQ
ncbi:MAG: hypothetical protein ACREBE_22870 [bacterium]